MRATWLTMMMLGCGWQRHEIAFQGAAGLATAMDWAQTRLEIAPKCAERNLILGPCPKGLAIDAYFLTVLGVEIGTGLMLPAPWRALAAALTFGIESTTVYNNVENGY